MSHPAAAHTLERAPDAIAAGGHSATPYGPRSVAAGPAEPDSPQAARNYTAGQSAPAAPVEHWAFARNRWADSEAFLMPGIKAS